MSQSPLARSTRRSLPAFSHAPSRLSKASSSRDLAVPNEDEDEEEEQKPISTPKVNQLVTPSRNRGTTGSGSPFTPRIIYSPYATSTPPGTLSRSSSIPFDMAASAKAARRAEEEKKSAPAPAPDTASKKKRFVRRKPLWKRLTAFPQAIIDQAIFHTPTSIQDVLPDEHLANPISLGLHGLHYLLVAPLFASGSENQSILRRSVKKESGVSRRWEEWESGGKDVGSGLVGGWTKFIFLVLFLGLTTANAAYLFTRYRTYDMQLRSAEEPIRSPHASPVPAPKRKTSEDQDVFSAPIEKHETQGHRALRLSGQALVALTKFIFHAILSAFGKPQKQPAGHGFNSADKIQSLRVWDPPEFCLAFFCALPPTAPLLTHLLTPLHPIYTPLLHLSTTFLLSHLAKSYNQLVKDRMVLSAEVMREYDQRFVYKRVFANRVDRGVGTNEAILQFDSLEKQ